MSSGPVFVLVALIMGQLVPVSELKFAGPDACDFSHYHSRFSDHKVTPLGGAPDLTDPAPMVCGFGTVFEVPFGLVYESGLPDDDFDGVPNSVESLLGLDPSDPDSDGDGLLDGDEDPDGDGLSTAEELVFAGTDPDDPDSDGDGTDDATQFRNAEGESRFWSVPVLANVLNGASISEAEVIGSFEQMNSFFKALRLSLVLLKVNLLSFSGSSALGDDGAGGASEGDGVLGDAERDQVRSGSGLALDGLADDPVNGAVGSFLAGKGLTVSYALDVDLSSDTPGLGTYPGFAIFQERRDTGDERASTLTHDVGDTLGLHHPEPGSPEDTASNFMTPSDAGRDAFVTTNGFSALTATDHQLGWLAADGAQRIAGFPGEFPDGGGPAQKTPYDYGGSVDLGWDQAMGQPAYRDLRYVGLTSVGSSDPFLWGYATLGGLFPDPVTDPSMRLRSETVLLFDTDDDPSTGSLMYGFGGVERGVSLYYEGDGAGGQHAHGAIRDFTTFTSEPLGRFPAVLALQTTFDRDREPIDVGQAIRFAIPTERLGLTATDVPVGVVSLDETGTVVDDASFVLERDRHLADPTLALDRGRADPGETVGYTLAGMPASEGFELAVDGSPVGSGTTDGSGGASGTFALPAGASGERAFVTAVGTSGAFGATAVRLPEPGAAALGAAALAALAALARRSRARRA